MLTVLIVDDNEQVRDQAMRALASADIRLASAADGRLALEQAMLLKPDIVICDVDMPEINGFDVLTALKADDSLATTQVMMLTAHRSRVNMRLGMSLGADDYLTKPFTDDELIEAVDGLIKRRDRMEVFKDAGGRQREDSLRSMFASSIAGGKPGLPVSAQSGASTQTVLDAAVLVCDIRSFATIAEKLTAEDIAKLLAEYFERAGEPILAHGGRHLKLRGDGLMAMFPADDSRAGTPSGRALFAATEMVAISRDVGSWMTLTFPDARLPPFKVACGLHCGAVAITQTGSSRQQVFTLSGETVELASWLKNSAEGLGWPIVASSTVLGQAGAGARVGGLATVTTQDGKTIDVGEVLEMRDVAAGQSGEPVNPSETTVDLGLHDGTRTERLRLSNDEISRLKQDAREHAGMAARAVKDALADKLSELRRGELPRDSAPLQLQGFHILRRLGAGGMSTIYLARREDTQDLLVLKVVQIDPDAKELTARFIREFSLLSTLSHPNIVRIHTQGFSGDTAYIAMEYFENGDLRSRLGKPLPPRQIVAIVEQAALALAAIHRDLKPENLMVRANGDVVLADFGIAKLHGPLHGAQPTLTLMGELIGSPSYMSPEQVMGDTVTSRSDLYALGVMLYEMATGNRPYKAGTLIEMLAQHAKAPPPQLPGPLQFLQPVLERLMAKQPAARYADADELLAALAPIKQALQAARQALP